MVKTFEACRGIEDVFAFHLGFFIIEFAFDLTEISRGHLGRRFNRGTEVGCLCSSSLRREKDACGDKKAEYEFFHVMLFKQRIERSLLGCEQPHKGRPWRVQSQNEKNAGRI